MKKYNHKKIEAKWQKFWEKNNFYQAKDPAPGVEKVGTEFNSVLAKNPKYYCLIEFPYPSGDGLHVGHVRSYTALDVIARKKRLEGFNVLYPIGWDAFGLPTENYAIKTGRHPVDITKENIKIFKKQIKSLGISFDWSREINTTDPNYYKWTQWIFLQLFKHGLAYKKKMPINWCPQCKIGLANEEVVDGKCERCGAEAEQKELEQWMLKITAYADRLIEDLETVDYLEKIKIQQINWIGRSEGAEIKFKIQNPKSKINSKFKIQNSKFEIKVFTTRPDTIFGATFLVLSPEHELVDKITTDGQKAAVLTYQEKAQNRGEIPRQARDDKEEKTGVFTGAYAINPATGKEIPIWVADYVIMDYGTGAIMAVPAHDERDFAFARKYNLDVIPVLHQYIEFWDKETQLHGIHYGSTKTRRTFTVDDYNKIITDLDLLVVLKEQAYKDLEEGRIFSGEGILFDSGVFSGLYSEKAKLEITNFVKGIETANYHLRDWVFSRQHYWGEPIPMVYCPECHWVPLPEEELPLELPFVKKYEPTNTGESPLAGIEKWVKTKCPKCGGPGRRETDTMPNWAGSSWYYLAYIMRGNSKFEIQNSKFKIQNSKLFKYWLPVDLYNGGMEHTTLHLLYSRFWHKFLYDIGAVPTAEPYQKRVSHGMILAPDGQKMSKSRGNVINPDEIVEEHGADVLRLYEMFIGPYDQTVSWDLNGVRGVRRFLERIFNFENWVEQDEKEVVIAREKTIKQVGEDIDSMRFNTAVSAMMIFVNKIIEAGCTKETFKKFLIILSVFAPHFAEEQWHVLDEDKSIFDEDWPKYDDKLIDKELVEIPIQINGKVRDKLMVDKKISEDEIKKMALASEKAKKYLAGQTLKKFIYVKGRLVSIVIS
ncbi:leucine--tRNA ligase [Candidatus Falkowbacteria bacterium]|nr:leucine--tRNA ligase [Candidatus Falkowbacteria bacterium]